MMQVLGKDLPPQLQKEVLSMFVHRYTGIHKPAWVKSNNPVQFADDKDWLAHTLFYVTKKGQIANRPNHCESSPTWPNNPELRKTFNAS